MKLVTALKLLQEKNLYKQSQTCYVLVSFKVRVYADNSRLRIGDSSLRFIYIYIFLASNADVFF